MTTISPVIVPYSGAIPGGIQQGMEIEVAGIVPHHAHNGFSFNLCQGPQVEPNTLIHFNVRLNEHCVVLNHMQNNAWGSEDRKSAVQFHKGQPFDLRIMVKPQMYKLHVNGRHIGDFPHRLPKEMAQFVVIKGEVTINYIRFQGKGGAPAPGPAFGPQPIYNPPVPLITSIPGGLSQGRMINISGVPFPNPSRFTINLQTNTYEGCDIAFHCDVRFRYSDSVNAIVRNHFQGGAYGSEERQLSYFPFMPNANFDALILIEHHSIKVAVNNQHLLEFRHRIPIHSVNTLSITGDVRLNQIRFQ